MQTPEALRRKLAKAGELREIVHTMKALASVSIHQHERAVASLRDYGRTLELGFQVLLRHRPEGFLEARPRGGPGRAAAVVVGSDQGMCGAFNERVARHAAGKLAGFLAAQPRVPVAAIGRRAAQRLAVAEPRLEICEVLPAPGSLAGAGATVLELLPLVESWHTAGGFEHLLVVHNRRTAGVDYHPRLLRVLPVSAAWLRGLERRPWPSRILPAFTMEWDRLYSALVREILHLTLYSALVESMESESASRLAAMEAAERNIDRRLEGLAADYRNARQGAITAELLDVVAGFEAITGPAG